jgi:hypothetical protein
MPRRRPVRSQRAFASTRAPRRRPSASSLDQVVATGEGLTLAADGKSAGLPFAVLGGAHGDIELAPSGGRHVVAPGLRVRVESRALRANAGRERGGRRRSHDGDVAGAQPTSSQSAKAFREVNFGAESRHPRPQLGMIAGKPLTETSFVVRPSTPTPSPAAEIFTDER